MSHGAMHLQTIHTKQQTRDAVLSTSSVTA